MDASKQPAYCSPVPRGMVDMQNSLSSLSWLRQMNVTTSTNATAIPAQPQLPRYIPTKQYSGKKKQYRNDVNEAALGLPPECVQASQIPPSVFKPVHYESLSKNQQEQIKFALPNLEEHANNTNDRPPFAYNTIIYLAMKASNNSKLQIADIYAKIMSQWAYYRTRCNETGWKNSIRHNLTVGHCFKKVSREEADGKGGYWEIDDTIAEKEISFTQRDVISSKLKKKGKQQLLNKRIAGKTSPVKPSIKVSNVEKHLERVEAEKQDSQAGPAIVESDITSDDCVDLNNGFGLLETMQYAEDKEMTDLTQTSKVMLPFVDGIPTPLNRSLNSSFNLSCSFMSRSFSGNLGNSFGGLGCLSASSNFDKLTMGSFPLGASFGIGSPLGQSYSNILGELSTDKK